MQFLSLLSTLALAATAVAGPLPEVEERAAATKYYFKIESQGGSKQYVGKYLTFSQDHSSKNKIVLVPEASKPSEASKFTVTGGSVHTTVPPNMVIESGLHSTGDVTFGSFITLSTGKGSNDYFTVSKGRLSFKPEPMGPTDADFQLCKFASSVELYALSLGATGTGKNCEKVYVGAIEV